MKRFLGDMADMHLSNFLELYTQMVQFISVNDQSCPHIQSSDIQTRQDLVGKAAINVGVHPLMAVSKIGITRDLGDCLRPVRTQTIPDGHS